MRISPKATLRCALLGFLLGGFLLGAQAEAKSGEGLRAFPGAEGYGAFTKGGRGGRVVIVTNLNKRGPGSFAWAVNEVTGPRTIVFEVSGVIDCENEIGFEMTSENDHVTIAGESSPGGVAIYNYRFFRIAKGAEEVMIRFLRLRGTRIHTKNDPDGVLIWHARNVILDHCSVAGACDETISASDAKNVTIQWTSLDESRKAEAHADYFENNGQWHNYGALFTRAKGVTIHHCLFAHHSKRNPLAKQGSLVEVVNNVIYNYSNEQQTFGVEGDGVKIANCYFKTGPDRRKRPVPVRDDVIAVAGCVSVERDGKTPGPPVENFGEIGSLNVDSMETAEAAYESVLRLSGALPRDATSRRMVMETRTGTGKQGYEGDLEADRAALPSRQTPPGLDRDRDGLPDRWEKTNGLDPSDPMDASKVTPGAYSPLERYHHERAKALISGQGTLP